MKIEIKNEGTFSLKKGENVLSVLVHHELFDTSHCGGHGTCGKCSVRFVTRAPLPLPADRKRFSPGELRDGWRLACMAKPQQDCVIEINRSGKKPFIMDHVVIDSNIADKGGITRFDHENGSPDERRRTMIVTDLGTTTIVMQLVELETGRVIDTYRGLNPQHTYGADVVSRMEQALKGKAEELSESVKKCLEDAAAKWTEEGYAPEKMIVTANTVMAHLYGKYDVTGLSKAPFTPVTHMSVFEAVNGIPCNVVPYVSAFVGGDMVAGMFACREWMKQDAVKTAVLIDLGTNAEMAVIGQERILCSAAAAGPAFEGSYGDVWGSELIDLVARLRVNGDVDETGLLSLPETEAGVSQKDIRSLQTAKAAVFAGIRILLDEYGIGQHDVEKVYLAGGFGYKVDTGAARAIGLLPSGLAERMTAVGNSALYGGYLYGKMLEMTEKPVQKLLSETRSINLAQSEAFEDVYIRAMDLKEMQ